jgi:predicted Zn-dependent protease
MTQDLTHIRRFIKPLMIILTGFSLSACSTNPATGEQQFAPFMSPSQEINVGAQEHQNVVKEFGIYGDQGLQSYVGGVGQKISANTERTDVQYKFFVVDSPVVNAFALPGGYVYASRGLVALANSEAELAAVLAHETGHITARHSAERYSRGVLASVGAAVLGAAIGSEGAAQAAGLGSELYIRSYSRGQENQADSLGIRYLTQGGYDPNAMSWFLSNLQADSALEGHIAGNGGDNFSYFSTHPATADRVSSTVTEARQYPAGGKVEREAYLKSIDGLVYGDSPEQGFVRGRDFYHTQMGFGFSAPEGFNIVNQPAEVVATSKSGAVMIFDIAGVKQNIDPKTYLTQLWMKDNPPGNVENIEVNGLRAATGGFEANVSGTPMTVRLVAIEWKPGIFARFQIGIPRNASAAVVDGLKAATYSFHNLSSSEKSSIKPFRIRLVTAKAGDTVASLAARQPFETYSAERFRVLNGLRPGEEVRAGVMYKIVSDS